METIRIKITEVIKDPEHYENHIMTVFLKNGHTLTGKFYLWAGQLGIKKRLDEPFILNGAGQQQHFRFEDVANIKVDNTSLGRWSNDYRSRSKVLHTMSDGTINGIKCTPEEYRAKEETKIQAEILKQESLWGDYDGCLN